MRFTREGTARACEAGMPRFALGRPGLRICLCLLALPLLPGIALSSQQQQQPPSRPPKPIILPEANRLPDANDQMEMQERKAKQQNFDAANAERVRQIAQDSAMLLKLATELKAEVDRSTDRQTLSVIVEGKADLIERLAHAVKEKMKLTVGGKLSQ